jgi:LacI family transcriptional regulator
MDVARAAGVASSTVSKALNGQGKLRKETRARVIAIANELGFRPNMLAQSLARGRSFTIGLLTTDIGGRFSIPLAHGIEDALGSGEDELSVFLCHTFRQEERERHHINSLLAKRVDGIIVTSDRTNVRSPIDLDGHTLPVVYAYTHVDDPQTLSVLPDDEQGTRLAVEHLISLGRRRIAHITGPANYEAVHLRTRAFRATLERHGLACEEHRLLHGSWEEQWGYQAVNQLLANDPTIDAIFCGNDQLARGAIDALRERGTRVPEDISIVGFDNWDVIAEATRPQLTTIDMNLYELGRVAGQELLKQIAGERTTGIIHLPCQLIVRASCVEAQKDTLYENMAG